MPTETRDDVLVSVVIPAYNASAFLRHAVDSVIAQTHRPLEIEIVNDGSTDSTLSMAEELSKVPRDGIDVRVIDVGTNKGAANALSLGFASARGEYICWLSADDAWISRDKVSAQLAAMRSRGASWSYFRDSMAGTSMTQARLVRPGYVPHLRMLDPRFVRDPVLRLMGLMFHNPINGSSVMVARECVSRYGQFDPLMRNVDADCDLWMRYSALGLRVAAVGGAPVFNLEHPTQTSKRTEAMVYGGELTRMRMLMHLERRGILDSAIRRFSPYLPFVLRPDTYRFRPVTIGHVVGRILSNDSDAGPVARAYARRAKKKLAGVRSPIMIDHARFEQDLRTFSDSETFKSFEALMGDR